MDTADYQKSTSHNSFRPIYWVYLALVLWVPIETLYTFTDAEGANSVSLSRLLGILLFLMALFNRRICFKRFPAVFWLLGVFLVFYAASGLRVPEDLHTPFLVTLYTLLQLVGLFLISVNLFENVRFRELLLRFYGWWGAVVSVGMISGLLGDYLGTSGRISIYNANPNITAGFLALGAVCILGNMKSVLSKNGIMSISAISIYIIALFQTGSRGAVIALVMGILGFSVCLGRKSKFLSKAIVLSVVLGVFGYFVLQAFQEQTVMALRLDNALTRGDTAGRNIIWSYSWDMFLEKPFWGHGGYNNFIILGTYLNYPIRDTHNIFLALLTAVGLLGGLPFIIAIFYALKKSWNYGRTFGNALPFALMCTLITINSAITGYNQKLFWIILAVAVASGLEYDSSRNIRKSVL